MAFEAASKRISSSQSMKEGVGVQMTHPETNAWPFTTELPAGSASTPQTTLTWKNATAAFHPNMRTQPPIALLSVRLSSRFRLDGSGQNTMVTTGQSA